MSQITPPSFRPSPGAPPNAPRRRDRRRSRDDSLTDEQLALLLQVTKLPASVLFEFLTTGGAFIDPDALVAELEHTNYGASAKRIVATIMMPEFWKTLVKRCFPLVTRLPLHIDQALRNGDYQVPADTTMRAIDMAWRAAARYIFTLLGSMRMRIFVGGALRAIIPFNPTLLLVDAPLETCDSYTGTPHKGTYAHTITRGIVDNESSDNSSFAFDTDMLMYDGAPVDSHHDKTFVFSVSRTEFPSIPSMNAVRNTSMRDMMTPKGAYVHGENLPVHMTFQNVVSARYELYWHVRNAIGLAARFGGAFPDIVTKLLISFTVDASRVDDWFLWAASVAIHARSTLTSIYREQIPVRLVLTYNDDVLHEENTAFGANELLGAESLFRMIALHFSARPALAVLAMFAESYMVKIDCKWDNHGNVVDQFVSSLLTLYNDGMRLGQVVGPPRLGRPMLFGSTASLWYGNDDSINQRRVLVRYNLIQ